MQVNICSKQDHMSTKQMLVNSCSQQDYMSTQHTQANSYKQQAQYHMNTNQMQANNPAQDCVTQLRPVNNANQQLKDFMDNDQINELMQLSENDLAQLVDPKGFFASGLDASDSSKLDARVRRLSLDDEDTNHKEVPEVSSAQSENIPKSVTSAERSEQSPEPNKQVNQEVAGVAQVKSVQLNKYRPIKNFEQSPVSDDPVKNNEAGENINIEMSNKYDFLGFKTCLTSFFFTNTFFLQIFDGSF